MLTLHKNSHLDHGVSQALIAWILERYANRVAFFIETVVVPEELASGLETGIWGPIEGDGVIPNEEVTWTVRGERQWASRMCDRPKRPTRFLTVIAGPRGDEPCSLYTAFGGKSAPREPWDLGLATKEERQQSMDFWCQHALCK